jgi:TfoX/Sxy family transcriptional regulator of competence genes
MTMDDKLLEHVRKAVADAKPLREVKMFGGIGFMLGGNMLAGVSDRGLLVRVGKDADEEALARPGAEPMIMRGRKMAGYIRVREGLDARSVKSWIKLARAHVETLPAKKPKSAAKKKSTKAKRA